MPRTRSSALHELDHPNIINALSLNSTTSHIRIARTGASERHEHDHLHYMDQILWRHEVENPNIDLVKIRYEHDHLNISTARTRSSQYHARQHLHCTVSIICIHELYSPSIAHSPTIAHLRCTNISIYELFPKHRPLSRLHCTNLCSARTRSTTYHELRVYTCDVTHELYFLNIAYSLVCIARFYAVHEHISRTLS